MSWDCKKPVISPAFQSTGGYNPLSFTSALLIYISLMQQDLYSGVFYVTRVSLCKILNDRIALHLCVTCIEI